MAENSIVTGQYVRISQTKAQIWERLVGFLIDVAVDVAWMITWLFLLADINSLAVSYLLLLPMLLYQPACEFFLHGQTLGKFLMRTRVVMVDGSSPGIGAFILRWLLLPIDLLFFGAVAAFSMLTTIHYQRLGDLAAGTMVCKIKSYAKMKVQIDEFSFVHDGYEPSYPAAAGLSADDADAIARTLGDHSRTRYQRIRQLAERIRQDYQIETADKRNERFLSTVLSDYRYYDLNRL